MSFIVICLLVINAKNCANNQGPELRLFAKSMTALGSGSLSMQFQRRQGPHFGEPKVETPHLLEFFGVSADSLEGFEISLLFWIGVHCDDELGLPKLRLQTEAR